MIITGATSGIGRALAYQAVKDGYIVGGTGRRRERLESMKKDLGDAFFFTEMDVANLEESAERLHTLIDDINGMDILVLNAGISNAPASSIISMEQEIINVNVRGFVQLFGEGFQYFRKKGTGQIVGISSMASFFGSARNAPYAASKAFISTYMQGYRNRCNKSGIDITITDIKAGFIVSEMTEGKKGIFWMANTGKAVQQILNDIQKKRAHTYVTRRWRLIAWLIRLTPRWMLERV